MLVSVNGAAAVDAGVELPSKVRLWCSLRRPDDAVQLVSVGSGGGAAVAAGSGAAAGGGRQQGAATVSQAGCNGSGAGGSAPGVQASAGGVDEQVAAVGSKRKRAQLYQSILSPAAKAARTGSPGGAVAGSAARRRPAENEVEVRELVNVQFRWDWRDEDGAYVTFDKDQCIEIETCYRRGWGAAIVWGTRFPVGRGENLKCVIDFADYTACIAGSDWVTPVRRWCSKTPAFESWDHQEDEVSFADVQKGWSDYMVVVSAFFDRPRPDGRVPTISRDTHELVKVRRIQNRRQLRLWMAEKESLEQTRGDKEVELSCVYAWHGSGKTPPTRIAGGEGFMMQYGKDGGFYLQGSYTAAQASYSHHTRYVYRSSDVQGLHADKNGVYHHLLLVKVLRGNPLKTAAVWKGKDFSYRESQLGREYDSVEGGPHQPVQAGPGPDDSIIYVVYHASQCLPEFIVTYKAK